MKSCILLPLLALGLSLSTLAAAAQTTAAHHPAARTRTAASTPALPKNIPPARGPMHTAYALKYVDIKIGTGELAAPRMFYTVHYTGWLASDGTKFDSSVDRGTPITFAVGAHRVIPGWDTGFEGMHVGGKRRLFIPYQLAYGEMGRAPIPPKADLIFDIELISMSDSPNPPTPPPAPAAPSTTPPPAASTPPAGTPPPQAAAPATPPAAPSPAKPPQ